MENAARPRPLVASVHWFIAGPDDQQRRRDRHYFVVKVSVSIAVLGSMLLPASMNHLAVPLAAAANMLWVWIDP